jgi:hypothetical protein
VTPSLGCAAIIARDAGAYSLLASPGGSGAERNIQASLLQRHAYCVSPTPGSTLLCLLGAPAPSFTCTPTSASPSATGNRYAQSHPLEILQTEPSASNVAGWQGNAPIFWRGANAGEGGFIVSTRFGISTGPFNLPERFFPGLSVLTPAPTDVNPSTLRSILSVACDPPDANIQFISANGSAATKVDLGASFPKPASDNTSIFQLLLTATLNASSVWRGLMNLTTGTKAAGAVTATLPSSTTLLNPFAYSSVGGVSAVCGLALLNIYGESGL